MRYAGRGWDDPDNPVVGVIETGALRGVNIRRLDVELADAIGMTPRSAAAARQPMGGDGRGLDLNLDPELGPVSARVVADALAEPSG